jgi:5-methylcytosine-specific restriction endonuclease McrA
MQKRSKGRVLPTYYSSKAELESKAVRGACIICHKPLGKGRKKYCSDACFKGWFSQFQPPFRWNELRKKARRRDKWTCLRCGRTKKELLILYAGTPYARKPKLVVDHIVPIALGGDEFDIGNLQTLCVDCNREKTKVDLRRIAEYRKNSNEKNKNAPAGRRSLGQTIKRN